MYSCLLATASTSGEKLKPKEKEVLMKTSKINGLLFLPWLDIDLNEKFSYAPPFCDPDGRFQVENNYLLL